MNIMIEVIEFINYNIDFGNIFKFGYKGNMYVVVVLKFK